MRHLVLAQNEMRTSLIFGISLAESQYSNNIIIARNLSLTMELYKSIWT